MALYKVYLLRLLCLCIFLYDFVSACESTYHPPERKYCENKSVSCDSQLVNLTDAEGSVCTIEAPGACSTWTFSSGYPTRTGTVRLIAFPECEETHGFSVLKILFKDVKWNTLQFRFMEYQNESRTFCRRFTVSPYYSIPELFYDCRWTVKSDFDKTFIFQYEAQNKLYREAGKYWFKLPSYSELDLTNKRDLTQWTPFLYVDVSESPALTVRWLQAPQNFGISKYELKVYDKDELKETKVFSSTNEEELSYTYSEYFPKYGEYKFEVRLHNDSCKNCTYRSSESPVINVGDSAKWALAVGVIGGLVVTCLLGAIWYSWKRMSKRPKTVKPPKLLIIYTQSNASHINVVEELAQYLRNFCNVDALLDKLDIPKTKTQDPYEWYNDAFDHLDFVMVVSSPPKCCNQVGLYRDVENIALRLLKNKFSDHNFRYQVFSVLLPYCTEQDIPNEVKHFLKFRLIKDWDKMLWFIHFGGKLPAFVDSACALLGPKLPGGEPDFSVNGVNLLKCIQQAQCGSLKVCGHKNMKEEAVYKSKITRLQTLIQPVQDVTDSHSERVNCSRDVSEVNPDVVKDYEDLLEISLNDLDLTGAGTSDLELVDKQRNAMQTVYDLDAMAL